MRVPVAAWWWAVGSGVVGSADAGPGRWSRVVVEATEAEAVRAALCGPCSAGWAADRLNEALGDPLPLRRPRGTASAVGYLVKAGLLVYLGGAPEFPDVHPDQVAALAARMLVIGMRAEVWSPSSSSVVSRSRPAHPG
ncbi:hypothetical protein [Streptomyces subrutilus]|uniref:hypothetical protein n=1 Tax=Streptomyces subrutilus TaxID=36818 RepID=UPI0033FAF60A